VSHEYLTRRTARTQPKQAIAAVSSDYTSPPSPAGSTEARKARGPLPPHYQSAFLIYCYRSNQRVL